MEDSKTDSKRVGGKRKRGLGRFIPWVIGGGIVALIISSLIPKPTPVEVVTVSRGPLTVSVFEEGKTRIRHRYIISSPIAGVLNRVELRAGAPIKAGETVLATLKPQLSSFLDPRAQAQAEARLQAAQASGMQRQAELDRAKSALDLGQKDLERSRALVNDKVISRQEFDQAENRVEILQRELRAAEFGKRVADFEVVQAEAALVQVQDATSGADTEAAPVEVRAPVNGFVLKVMEESARVVTPGTAIMEVGDIADLEAEIELLSSDAVGVKPGAEVSIEEWGGEEPLHGQVALVEPGGFTKVSALGVEEQRVLVRVNFDELPEGVLLGDRYRVEARIVTWSGEDIVQIPTGALFRRGGDWMSFVVQDGVARLTKVEIGHSNGVFAEVLGGVSEGAQVVIHPPEVLADGGKVAPGGKGK